MPDRGREGRAKALKCSVAYASKYFVASSGASFALQRSYRVLKWSSKALFGSSEVRFEHKIAGKSFVA
jgi:hypothetical protein